MAQWNLLKLKKYEGLVSVDNSIQSIYTLSIKCLTYLNLVGTSPKQGMSTRPCLQIRMGNLTQPALDILVTNIKTHTNVQHHTLELAMCVEYLATYVKIVQIRLIISNGAQSYLCEPTINNISTFTYFKHTPQI